MSSQSMEKRTLKKGEVIFEQGKYEDWMYDVLQGRVGIYAGYGTEDEKLVAEMGTGEFFGEMGMIECYPRSATAVSLEEDTCVEKISQADFSDYFKEHSDRIYTIMKQLSLRIRKTTEEYMKLLHNEGNTSCTKEKSGEKKGGLMAKLKALGGNHNHEKRKPGEYGKGEVIFNKGDLEPFMYDIHSGKVGIYSDYGTPQQVLLAELSESDFIGEMGLVEGSPRSATAVALEQNTRLQKVDAETFDEYFRERPAKVLMLMQQLSGRLRQLNKEYLEAQRASGKAAKNDK